MFSQDPEISMDWKEEKYYFQVENCKKGTR